MIPWYIFALAAAVFIVVRDLAQKRALKDEHTEEMLVARAVFLVPLLVGLALVTDVQVPADVLPWLYVSSVVATAGYLLLMKGLRHLDISLAGPLQNISPLFLLIIGASFLGERPTPIQFLGILLIVVGTYILEAGPKTTFFGMLRKLYRDRYAWGVVMAAFVLSISQTLDKSIINAGTTPFAYLFWVWLFLNINCWLIHMGRYKWGEFQNDVVRDWRWLCLGAVALFGQLLCYYAAISRGPVILVIPITRLSAFGLVFLGGALYHESHKEQRAMAAAVMLLGALLILAPNL